MLNASQRGVNKNSLTWCTSWKRLEDIFARRLEDVLKMFWRHFYQTSWKRLKDVFARRLEDVLKRYGQDECIALDQDVLKTSSEDVRLRRIYSSWSRRLEEVFWRRRRKTYSRRFQDVFKVSSLRRMFAGKAWVEVNGSCLMQDKNMHNYGTIVKIYIVYEMNKKNSIQAVT